MKLIVPFYDLKLLSQILALAGKCQIVVIANIWSGPGAKLDKAWASAINKLRKAGMEVIGYIDAMRWPGDGRYKVTKSRLATSDELLAESDDWANWYGVLKSFYDDVGAKNVPVTMNADMLNWGTEPTSLPRAGVVAVVHEGHDYLASKPSRVPATQQAVMALAQPDFKPALATAVARRVAHFFATPRRDKKPNGEDDWTTYDELPSYLVPMATAVGKVKF